MKRTIGITAILVLLLGSCNFIGSIINPVIGTWETTILGVSVSSTFNADDTFTDTNSLGAFGVTQSGTWTSDATTITKTLADETTQTLSYSFNSDKTEMVLALYPNGLVVTYTRQ